MSAAADPDPTSASDGAGLPAVEVPVTGSGEASSRPAVAPSGLIFDDPFDRPSPDDADRGWGELPTGSADDDFARFLSQKPPHHL
ncbi:hypothetical protein [Streptomyces sp. NRRL F-5123]|uniref:hypothetical protein n=1 Tax=Streptomyces sp. NRRL F-5123 TaxID=1463856 RepID=UPI001F1DA8CF|nr:hypothetical protein [Streptomyces sp. NRRL F-5123]